MSSYLLPYDTLYNLWMTPIYEWEPAVPPETSPDGGAGQDTDADGACPSGEAAAGAASPDTTKTAQPMKLVVKGTKWVLVPVSSMRENQFYNQLQDSERDEDEKRALARKAGPPRPHLPVEGEIGPQETGPTHTDTGSGD